MNKKTRALIAATLTAGSIAVGLLMSTEETYDIYLPLVAREQPMLGTNIEGSYDPHIPGIYWKNEDFVIPAGIYEYILRWSLVEQSQGTYTWPEGFANTEEILDGYGLKTIINVPLSPEWARKWSDCRHDFYPAHGGASPPVESAYDDYANFVNSVVATARPWGVEIWREPNVPCGAAYDDYYGAWVPTFAPGETLATPYYKGGLDYGRFVATVVPIIKTAHPEVKIIAGAINGYKNPDQFAFVEGMLRTTPNADFYSMHKYEHWNMAPGGTPDPALFFNEIDAYSTAIAGTGKQVIISEMSVYEGEREKMNPTNIPTLEYQKDEWFKYQLAHWGEHPNVYMLIWYSLANNIWGEADLVRESTPMPAFYTYCDALDYGQHPCHTFTPTTAPTETPTATPTETPTPTETLELETSSPGYPPP